MAHPHINWSIWFPRWCINFNMVHPLSQVAHPLQNGASLFHGSSRMLKSILRCYISFLDAPFPSQVPHSHLDFSIHFLSSLFLSKTIYSFFRWSIPFISSPWTFKCSLELQMHHQGLSSPLNPKCSKRIL